jgi:molybdopterin-guanine dinucleotide biosynthesis protein B
MNQHIISITGRSGSGKTTLIEKLIVHYKSMNKKVSVVKSMRHHFETDPPGKDTFRYRDSGASASIITNGRKFALISENDRDENPLELAKRFFADSDIIIIEGFKEGNQQKIEVIGDSKEPALFFEDKNIKILVTDNDINTELPIFRRDDIKGIAEAISSLLQI